MLQGHLEQCSFQNRCQSSSSTLGAMLTSCCGNACASRALDAPFDLFYYSMYPPKTKITACSRLLRSAYTCPPPPARENQSSKQTCCRLDKIVADAYSMYPSSLQLKQEKTRHKSAANISPENYALLLPLLIDVHSEAPLSCILSTSEKVS